MPDPFDIDDYDDPRIPGWSWGDVATLVAILAAIAMIGLGLKARLARGDDAKPVLWIYTSPQHCQPCRVLEAALKKPPMNQFRVVKLTPPAGCSIPCLYWRDAKGQWRHQVGWSNAEAFMGQWRRDVQK